MAIENQSKSFLKEQVFIFEEKAVKISISSNHGQVISARYNLFGEQFSRQVLEMHNIKTYLQHSIFKRFKPKIFNFSKYLMYKKKIL